VGPSWEVFFFANVAIPILIFVAMLVLFFKFLQGNFSKGIVIVQNDNFRLAA
jgi:hypothetical protein